MNSAEFDTDQFGNAEFKVTGVLSEDVQRYTEYADLKLRPEF